MRVCKGNECVNIMNMNSLDYRHELSSNVCRLSEAIVIQGIVNSFVAHGLCAGVAINTAAPVVR